MPCTSTFSRPYNLRRHILTQHDRTTVTFVDCNPNVQQSVTYYPVPLSDPSDGRVPSAEGPIVHPRPKAMMNRQAEPRETPGYEAAHEAPTIHRTESPSSPIDARELDMCQLPPCQDEDQTSMVRKRKLSCTGYDRIAWSRRAPPVPSYDVKLSSKFDGEMKGSEWLCPAAKKTFDHEHVRRLAEWGVTQGHSGTCILVPEDWRSLDPMQLVDLFDLDNCPLAQVSRLRYQYADHSTSYVRARAWFAQWPRSGASLDNLMGNGDCQPVDASHTCHHDSCIIHVTLEPAHVNHERKACCEGARKLRRARQEVPEYCGIHDPPKSTRR